MYRYICLPKPHAACLNRAISISLRILDFTSSYILPKYFSVGFECWLSYEVIRMLVVIRGHTSVPLEIYNRNVCSRCEKTIWNCIIVLLYFTCTLGYGCLRQYKCTRLFHLRMRIQVSQLIWWKSGDAIPLQYSKMPTLTPEIMKKEKKMYYCNSLWRYQAYILQGTCLIN